MRYIRYIGLAHVRQITADDWRRVGINAETVVWGPFNGFAVPLDQLNEDQIRKAIEPDSSFVITGEGEDSDEEFVPQPTENPLVTPQMLEAGRVDITDDAARDRALETRTDGSEDDDADRSTPRTTTGGAAER